MTQADDQIWYRLELLTRTPETTGSALWGHGALGVEVQDRDTFMEDGSIAPVPEGRARLIAFFDTPFDVAVLPADCEVISNVRYDDRSWETAWMKYFRPVHISARAVVGPPWEQFAAPPGGVRIEIEPGLAFGTGTHETTGLCAELLDEICDRHAPASMLDVGCGTGVLAMIAAGLGVAKVAGIDNDPVAVDVAQENVERNGFAGAIHVSGTPLGRLGLYDVVVANILARVLVELRDDLCDRLNPGGYLVASGITQDQADQYAADFASPELEFVERRDRGEWAAFVWRKV